MERSSAKSFRGSAILSTHQQPEPLAHNDRSRHSARSAGHRVYCVSTVFGAFALDTVNQCLVRTEEGSNDASISLSPRAYELLRYLVQHPNRLVSQEELLEALWPETYVQPEVLKNHLLEIRRALGDDPKNPRYIQTLPKRGYRFLPKVDEPSSGTSAPEPASRLIGRSMELHTLHNSLQNSLRGLRQIVFVTGEGGIGKTALVDEFIRQAMESTPELRVARGQCVEVYGGIEPYYPMLQALRDLCTAPAGSTQAEILGVQAPTWLAQLPFVLKRQDREIPQRGDLGATRDRMLREICDALETITADRPLLLVFEDLHWADPSTIDLISAVARRRSAAKLMVIANYVPVDVSLSGHPLKMVKPDLQIRRLCREIELMPLEYPQVAEYLATELETACTPEGLADLLYRHSDGNPLFMVAGLEQLTEGKLLDKLGGLWVLTRPIEDIDQLAPKSLRQMIELRIEQLGPEQIKVLEIVSLKLQFPLRVAVGLQVAEMHPEHLERTCEELVRRHYLVRVEGPAKGPSYKFRHELYKRVVYGRIPPERRRNLHLALALSATELHVQLDEDAETELAYQFERGGDYARAIHYLIIASQTTARRFEIQQSIAILEHAMNLVKSIPEDDRGPVKTDLLQRLATVHLALRNPSPLDIDKPFTVAGATRPC